MLQHLLTQHGYRVHCASSLDEAMAMLKQMPPPCLILWDPITLPITAAIVTYVGRRGVHIATIPIGISSRGQASDGSPILEKRLTSYEAILTVLREHCREAEERALG